MSELLLHVEAGPAGAGAAVARVREVLQGSGSVALLPWAVDADARAALETAVGVDEPAAPTVILTTSGSAGRPKGVELPAAAIRASAIAAERRLGGPGLWLTAIPVTGAGGLNTIARSLLNGVEPVLWPGLAGALHFDGAAIAPALVQTLAAAKRAGLRAYTSLVPTQIARLVAHADADDADAVEALRLLADFHAVLVGADALNPALRHTLRSYGIHFVTTYGATETCGGCIYDDVPLDGVTIEFIGDEPGRIAITGPNVAARYRDDDPTLGAGRWLSQDLGRMRMGHLELVGRIDDLVKVGGSSIALTLISRQFTALGLVDDVITLARADNEWGSVPVAFIVGGDAPTPTLRTFAAAAVGRTSLPLDIVRLPALPLLPNGKPDRRALLEMVK